MATHLITGAGSGIGEAVARRLADRGDELVLIARNEQRAASLAQAFSGSRTVVGDLADPGGLSAALLSQNLPDRVDSLLHVAGGVDLGAVADLSADTWRRTVDVNLLAPAELTRILLPALRAAAGHVIFLNSTSGLSVSAQWSAYGASKFGLRALADALRQEERGHGLRVTSIYPSRTATPMQVKVHEQEGKEYDADDWIDPASVATTILMALDLPRDAEVTDLTVRPGPDR